MTVRLNPEHWPELLASVNGINAAIIAHRAAQAADPTSECEAEVAAMKAASERFNTMYALASDPAPREQV